MRHPAPPEFQSQAPLLDEHEAAEFLTLPLRTIRERRYLGQPPAFVRMGRAVRYRRCDLLHYLESCVKTPEL